MRTHTTVVNRVREFTNELHYSELITRTTVVDRMRIHYSDSVESAEPLQLQSTQKFRAKHFTVALVRRFRLDFPLEVTHTK